MFACLFSSSLLRIGDDFVHQQSLHCCLPSPTLNTLPLICLTSPWYHLSIFASAFSSRQFYLPVVFRCTGFWLWPHDRNTEAYVSVQSPKPKKVGESVNAARNSWNLVGGNDLRTVGFKTGIVYVSFTFAAPCDRGCFSDRFCIGA